MAKKKAKTVSRIPLYIHVGVILNRLKQGYELTEFDRVNLQRAFDDEMQFLVKNPKIDAALRGSER